MKLVLSILALPLSVIVCAVLLAVIPREEWSKLNDSLPPP